MKNHLHIIILCCLSSLLFSCNSYDEPTLNPNENLGNPEFEIKVTNDFFLQPGGTSTMDITTNTKWWTVTSNSSWLVAPTDTLKGSSGFNLNIPSNETTDTRIGILTFKSGTIGPKVTYKITQKGYPSHISVSTNEIKTDGYGGEYTIDITSDATWTVDIKKITDVTASWVTATPMTAFGDGKVTIKIAKNVDTTLALLEAAITISVADESEVINVKQVGSAASDDPNNVATIYFDDFNPTANVAVGSTWTLTDARDDQKYRVRLMADGRIWMIDDLKFTGNSGDQKTNLGVFSGNGDTNLGTGIPGYWGDVCKPAAGLSYFYNWQAVMQSYDARSAGGWSTSVVVESPYQGIAPDKWQVPSIKDYQALGAKISASDWVDAFEPTYAGNVNHGDVGYGGLIVIGSGDYAAYYTITQENRDPRPSPDKSSPLWNFIGSWNINKSTGEAKAIYSGYVTSSSANRNFGYAVRLMMQTTK